ncbi:hypothetical protein GUITHDRAFT_85230, partial [Guillardia theta CCMP2712]
MSGSRGSQASRSVFVGNIPYNATEEQLEDIFRAVGHVVSFRWLVKNSDTGQPKGFGFCEFRDAQTAESAIRNLNNTEFNGRLLRIDYASSLGEGKSGGGGSGGSNSGASGAKPLMNAHDQIMAVVSTMSIEQMYNVMGQLKTICAQNREQARELFNTYPQLSMAVLRMHDLLSKYSSGGPPPPVGIHSDPLPRGGMSGLSGPGMPPPPQLGGGMGMPGNVPPSAMGQPVGGASVTSGRGGSGD